MVSLLADEGGYLDQLPPDVPTMLALCGMNEVQDSIGLFDFVDRAMQHPRLPITVFCETTGEQPSFRTGCRQETQDDAQEGTDPEPGPESGNE